MQLEIRAKVYINSESASKDMDLAKYNIWRKLSTVIAKK